MNKQRDIAVAVKGTSEVTKDKAKISRVIEDVARKTAELYGYPEMTTPIIQYRDILTSKFDNESELAEEIYCLSDRGERELALRYDLTVPFARYVAQNAKSLTFPVKRFECGEVFRDGPVKTGRAREFVQCDMDCIEVFQNAYTAYEQVSCAFQVFDSIGISNVTMRFSSRPIIERVLLKCGIATDDVPSVIRVLDKSDKLSEEQVRKELADIGLAGKSIDKIYDMLDIDIEYLYLAYAIAKNANCNYDDDDRRYVEQLGMLVEFATLVSQDENIASRCKFDLSLMRGQDYYTGIVFEFFTDGFASSIAAGGQYDSLVGNLMSFAGMKPIALYGCGLSFGVTPILSVFEMRAKKESNSKQGNISDGIDGEDNNEREGLIIISCGENTNAYVARLANCVRRSGGACNVDVSNKSVSKKMKLANKAGYRGCIVYGDDEAADENENMKIKDMKTGEEFSITRDALCKVASSLEVIFS